MRQYIKNRFSSKKFNHIYNKINLKISDKINEESKENMGIHNIINQNTNRTTDAVDIKGGEKTEKNLC